MLIHIGQYPLGVTRPGSSYYNFYLGAIWFHFSIQRWQSRVKYPLHLGRLTQAETGYKTLYAFGRLFKWSLQWRPEQLHG